MKRIKICTLVAILADCLALCLLFYLGTLTWNVIAWLCLGVAAIGFLVDIKRAVSFYLDIKKN